MVLNNKRSLASLATKISLYIFLLDPTSYAARGSENWKIPNTPKIHVVASEASDLLFKTINFHVTP